MAICEKCDAEINDEDKFCWNCGCEFTDDIIIQLSELYKPKSAMKIRILETGPHYCNRCGNDLWKTGNKNT